MCSKHYLSCLAASARVTSALRPFSAQSCCAWLSTWDGCREKGWWIVDSDAYYDSPKGRYMAYNNTVRDYVATLERAMGPMVPLNKHLLAVAFQLAALRDAFAIAWCVWTRSQHRRLAASCSMMQAGCSNPWTLCWPGRASDGCCLLAGSIFNWPWRHRLLNLRMMPFAWWAGPRSSFPDTVILGRAAPPPGNGSMSCKA